MHLMVFDSLPPLWLILVAFPAVTVAYAIFAMAGFGAVFITAPALAQFMPVSSVVPVLSLVGFAVPAFWLAQMLMLIFSLKLDLLPAQGMRSLRADLTGWAGAWDVAKHLILPASTLAIFNLALIARETRSSMSGALRLEYVTFARSKGVAERRIVWVHALRNSMLPIVTVIGLHVRTLIAGAVLTETVFALPGIGRLTYDAILSRDYPVLMGIFILIGLTVVIGNLLTDIAYAWLDPRVRLR